MDELCQSSKGNCNITGITETWTNSNISDSEINIEGCYMFRTDRKEGKGGGVILYITEKLTAVMCLDIDVGFEEVVTVWCKIKLSSDYLLAGVYYRSPAVLILIIIFAGDVYQAMKVPHVAKL